MVSWFGSSSGGVVLVTPEEMKIRPVVVEFAARMLADLTRRDQQVKGELYVRGPLLDGKRKSM
jgi:uncharacterized protein YbjT (DUF2867 family)